MAGGRIEKKALHPYAVCWSNSHSHVSIPFSGPAFQTRESERERCVEMTNDLSLASLKSKKTAFTSLTTPKITLPLSPLPCKKEGRKKKKGQSPNKEKGKTRKRIKIPLISLSICYFRSVFVFFPIFCRSKSSLIVGISLHQLLP